MPGCNAVFWELKCNVMPVQITVLWEVSERFVLETIAKMQRFGNVSRPHVHGSYADIGQAAFDLGSTESTPTSSLVGLARAHSVPAPRSATTSASCIFFNILHGELGSATTAPRPWLMQPWRLGVKETRDRDGFVEV